MPDDNLTYEEAYAKLEAIVQQLESQNLPLEDALNLFEKGQELSAYCQQLLEQAELKVSQLVNGDVSPLADD